MARKRKERLTAFNRANIMKSASQLFKEKGVDGTTMDDIAKASEYSKTTIYGYFSNKEDLVNHIMYDGMALFKRKLCEEAKQSTAFEDFYKRFCQLLLKFHDEQPIYYEGIVWAIACVENVPTTDILQKIYLSGKDVNQIIEEKMALAIKAKEISLDAGDICSTVLFMWFCIMGILEKSTVKESYISAELNSTKQEFTALAFKKLYGLLTEKIDRVSHLALVL